MSPRSQKFLAWCKRYISVTLLVAVAIIIAILFLNDSSVVRSYENQQEINRLTAEIKAYQDTLQYYRALDRSLETDAETMERIVRENYHMQRPNEDVYIIE